MKPRTKRVKAIMLRCECADKRCPVHPGSDCLFSTYQRNRIRTLRRVDMEDRTGTRFCIPCADDASESGLFS